MKLINKFYILKMGWVEKINALHGKILSIPIQSLIFHNLPTFIHGLLLSVDHRDEGVALVVRDNRRGSCCIVCKLKRVEGER